MKSNAGFSLMEILIAITLLAIVGTFVVGKLTDRLDEGSYSSAKIQIQNFKQLLEDYRRYCFQYPTTDQGLEALVKKPAAAPECKNYPPNGFIQGDKVPQDPWGMPYDYKSDGSTFTIKSYGKDRKEGGEGVNKDIDSNDL